MSYKRKSWQEKLADSRDFPKVCKIDSTKSKRWGNGTFVIPAPMEVYELMRQVPEGKVTTIDDLRRTLARRHGATIACPITTGIFAWISAHAAAEAEAQDQKMATGLMRDMFSLDTKKALKEAGVPVRCINSAGGYTFFTPTDVEINKKYADYGAVTIDAVGHYPMLEKPTEFNGKLRDVLKELAAKK